MTRMSLARTSKLGGLEDIEHRQSDDLADSDYGRIVGFMRRARMS